MAMAGILFTLAKCGNLFWTIYCLFLAIMTFVISDEPLFFFHQNHPSEYIAFQFVKATLFGIHLLVLLIQCISDVSFLNVVQWVSIQYFGSSFYTSLVCLFWNIHTVFRSDITHHDSIWDIRVMRALHNTKLHLSYNPGLLCKAYSQALVPHLSMCFSSSWNLTKLLSFMHTPMWCEENWIKLREAERPGVCSDK